jgi:hypothetical protein
VAQEHDGCAWRATARAIGMVRAAVVLRVAVIVIAIVEVLSLGKRSDGLLVYGVGGAALVSDAVAAAGAWLLASRAPVGRSLAAVAGVALVAATTFDGWALAWEARLVPAIPGSALHVALACALVAALGVIASASAVARAIDREAVVARLQSAGVLLVLGTLCCEVTVVLLGTPDALLLLAAAVLLLAGTLFYIAGLGRVRAAIRDHAPAPPRATALVE